MLQFNNSQLDNNPFSAEYFCETPEYSIGDAYITFTFNVWTNVATWSGDWFIGYLEFHDQKGNFSRYCGNPVNNDLKSEFLDPQQTVSGITHVQIQGTSSSADMPVLNSIRILNPTVEKPGTLKVEANITSTHKLSRVQFTMANENTKDTYTEFAYPNSDKGGTRTYVFEVQLSEQRHNGQWRILGIWIDDIYRNTGLYGTDQGMAYLENLDDKSAPRFPVPTFRVTGVQGDETAPAVTAVEVLNPNKTVSKPGILQIRLDLVEEGSGITCVEVEYERADVNEPDIASRYIYQYCVEGYGDSYAKHTIMPQKLKTGSYTFDIPVGSIRPDGIYRIRVRELRDAAGNLYNDYANKGILTEFTVKDEFDYAFEMGITNGALLQRIQALNPGETGRILLSNRADENILTKEMLDAIADQDKTLVCYRDGYQWIFDGKNVKGNKTKDLNLTARVFTISGENLSSGKSAVCISFENNGKLPGKIEFRFRTDYVLGYFGVEEKLHFYHIDAPESGYETDPDYANSDYEEVPRSESNIRVVLEEQDGWCYVKLAHNSKYVLSGSTLRKYTPNTNQRPVQSPVNPEPTEPAVDATEPETTPEDTTAPTPESEATIPESVPEVEIQDTPETKPVETEPVATTEPTKGTDDPDDNTWLIVAGSLFAVAIVVALFGCKCTRCKIKKWFHK